jgi:guanine nucleotide-binding protein G(i) subunit alpha
MAESLVLFESVINSRWFLRTSIILFLNKIDVFKAKLPKVFHAYFFSPFRLCSPCVPSGSPRQILSRVHRWSGRQQGRQVHPLAIYAGEPCTTKRVPPVCGFLVSMSSLVINVHGCSITQATDTSNIRLVFITVRETILQNALKESGIL